MAASVAASVVWLTVAEIITLTPGLLSGTASVLRSARAAGALVSVLASDFLVVTGAFNCAEFAEFDFAGVLPDAAAGTLVSARVGALVAGMADGREAPVPVGLRALPCVAAGVAWTTGVPLPDTFLDGFSANGFDLAATDFSAGFTETATFFCGCAAGLATTALVAGESDFADLVFFAAGIGVFAGFFIAFAKESEIA